jgi:DnaJ-domain-containing protein 1
MVAPSRTVGNDNDIGPRDVRPVLNGASGLGAVRLSPVEGFVLSRVDGRTSYAEICALTGLGEEATLEILRKLRRERLIVNPGEAAEASSLLERHDDGSPVDPSELAEGPGLDTPTKLRIVRLHRRIKGLKAHELLGLHPGADAAAVKRAYFAASKDVHPDRYYGQDLGRFRDRLNDIFAQLTWAFEQCKK